MKSTNCRSGLGHLLAGASALCFPSCSPLPRQAHLSRSARHLWHLRPMHQNPGKAQTALQLARQCGMQVWCWQRTSTRGTRGTLMLGGLDTSRCAALISAQAVIAIALLLRH